MQGNEHCKNERKCTLTPIYLTPIYPWANSSQQPQREVGSGTGNGQTDGNNTSANAVDVRHEEQFVSCGWLGETHSKRKWC
jgi:hypothetical protein